MSGFNRFDIPPGLMYIAAVHTGAPAPGIAHAGAGPPRPRRWNVAGIADNVCFVFFIHGVGIQPTVPVHRTRKGIREGRDEQLDVALNMITTVSR